MANENKYLDSNGLLYVWQKIKTLLSGKVDVENGKGLSTNDYTSAEKTKLAGIAEGATAVTIDSTLSSSSTNAIQNNTVYSALGDKVDKISGKGLSTNDYTTDEKTKLSGIASGAEQNVLESVSVNGTALSVTNKGVNITVPTNNNQLTNGAGYQTASDVSTAIASAIQDISGISFQVVQNLPASGQAGIIYLIAHSHDSDDGYDEFIWVNNAYEKLGHADVDLSGYLQSTDKIANAEIDTIFAS